MTALVPGDVSHVAPVVPAGATPLRHTVELNGVEYGIELKDYRHQGIASTREGITAHDGDPSEALFDHSGTWWRHRFDWTHGAGQKIGDFRAGASDDQFRDSLNIDVTVPLQLSLSPLETDKIGPTTTIVHGTIAASYLYWTDGTGVISRCPIDGAGSLNGGAATNITGYTGGVPHNLSSYAGKVYVAGDAKFSEITGNAQTATLGDAAKAYYKWGKAVGGGRLIAARSDSAATNYYNVLIEIGTATETIIKQAPIGYNWVDAASVGSLIYVAANTEYQNPSAYQVWGKTSELYSLTTTSTGSLVLGSQAAPFGVGEVIRSIVGQAGLLIIVTNHGIRIAQADGGGTLTYGPLFASDIITDQRLVSGVVANDGYAYVGVSDYEYNTSAFAGGTHKCWLIRIDLSTFTDPLVPSWTRVLQLATNGGADRKIEDLVAAGGGSYPFIISSTYAPVGGATSQISSVDFLSGLQTSGTIASGRLYFGTIEQKRLTSFVIRHDALRAGESIQVAIADQDGTAVIAPQTNSTVGSTGLTVDLAGVLVDWVEVTLTLNGVGASSSATSPVVRSWEIRGYPVVTTAEQWLVPLIVNTETLLGPGQGQDRSFDPMATCVAIEDLWRSKATITYREGARSRRVRIDNFQITGTRWIEDGDYLETVVLVQLLSA